VESFLGTLVEITAIKEAEQQLRESLAQQQDLLLRETSLRRELDHRVRNNLAGLLGLISVYQRSAREPAEIGEALRGKVLAMKGVHEIIARSPGAPVGLAGLVERLADQLLVPGEVGRVCVAGASVRVPPGQAGAVAMILQELFTNSRKYGALSVPPGRIMVEWTAAPNAGGGTALDLSWAETGGPVVSGSREFGVGLRLIEGFASADLRGSCRFSFDAPGLRCDLRANLESGG
jgi:two-component sensor histidine kinase